MLDTNESIEMGRLHSQTSPLVATNGAQEPKSEILAALDRSIKSFSDEYGLNKKILAQDITPCSKASVIAKRVLEAGKRAQSNLDIFWRNIERYSTESVPHYMQCHSISIRDSSSRKESIKSI